MDIFFEIGIIVFNDYTCEWFKEETHVLGTGYFRIKQIKNFNIKFLELSNN